MLQLTSSFSKQRLIMEKTHKQKDPTRCLLMPLILFDFFHGGFWFWSRQASGSEHRSAGWCPPESLACALTAMPEEEVALKLSLSES